MERLKVLSTFGVQVAVALSIEQRQAAMALLNLHYLGDTEANEFNKETCQLESKYRDKETEVFRESHCAIDRTYRFDIVVDLLENGRLVPHGDVACQLDDPIDQTNAPAPERFYPGDIWEFEAEVKVKGRRKLVSKLFQWEVIGWHNGEHAWQLKSTEGDHYTYLFQNEPSYSRDIMKRIRWGGKFG